MSNTERIYEVEEIRGLRQSGTRQEWHVRPGGCRFGKEGQRVIAQYELPGLCLSAEASHPLLTQSYCGPAKLATTCPSCGVSTKRSCVVASKQRSRPQVQVERRSSLKRDFPHDKRWQFR